MGSRNWQIYKNDDLKKKKEANEGGDEKIKKKRGNSFFLVSNSFFSFWFGQAENNAAKEKNIARDAFLTEAKKKHSLARCRFFFNPAARAKSASCRTKKTSEDQTAQRTKNGKKKTLFF